MGPGADPEFYKMGGPLIRNFILNVELAFLTGEKVGKVGKALSRYDHATEAGTT